ncbi:type II toxin-antitoxin system RelE/ParE family toxin [Pseudoroseomonas globiformis]|uniref:Type II toxin-antitoxin system RelE/ParE family toxin n=1 Tax=Teichococcus globiformis TaxID=2307229 RepID=A0ABV7FY52_9PROT
MTTYKLDFSKSAKKTWDKLDNSVKAKLKAKLVERLENPKVPSAQLHGEPNLYKIKIMVPGVRLIYQVLDDEVVVLVLKIANRDEVYDDF